MLDKKQTDTEQASADSVDRRSASAAAVNAEPPAGDLFSVKQLISTSKRNKVELTSEGIEVFHEEMQESGWVLYGKPVNKKGIIKALRGWAKYHPEYAPEEETEEVEEEMEDEYEEKKSPVLSLDEKARKFVPKDKIGGQYWTAKYVPQYCSPDIFTSEELKILRSYLQSAGLKWDAIEN